MQYVNRLFSKDARLLDEVLPKDLPTVDVTITSPPYWNLKDYGGVRNQIGYGQGREKYLADIELVLKNCLGVTKSTGSLWLVVDDYSVESVLQLLPWEIAKRARDAGWILRDLIIWDKQHSVPWQTNGRMRKVSEYMFVMSKTDKYKWYLDRIKTLDEISKWWVDFPERFNPKGKTPTNIWSIPFRTQGAWNKPSKINHHCPFPTKLVARIIELTTDAGDLVMDPFAGSSVVLAQAAAMGRQFVGFEINKKYVEMFQKVVKKEVAAEWKEIKRWRAKHNNVPSDFERTIMKLRALKYTRQVTKPFLEITEPDHQSEIQAVICSATIPRHFNRGRPFEVCISVVVNENREEFALALEEALDRAATPPLSQYGIRLQLEVATYRNLKRRKGLLNRRFYLYPDYKPRKCLAGATLRRWFDGGRLSDSLNGPKIPMLANIAVDVGWVMDE